MRPDETLLTREENVRVGDVYHIRVPVIDGDPDIVPELEIRTKWGTVLGRATERHDLMVVIPITRAGRSYKVRVINGHMIRAKDIRP